jgi:hypothetical protein
MVSKHALIRSFDALSFVLVGIGIAGLVLALLV